MCPCSIWADILWAQCSILCNSMGEGKFWPGKSKHILSFICWMLKQRLSCAVWFHRPDKGGGRQFPSCSNPQLWRCLLESEHSLFQPTDKGAHPTSKLGCLPSCSVSSKISKGNRANKYVERVCSVCGKRQNNPPRTYAQSIAVAPTLGMRTSGCISLIFFHRPSVSTELGMGDRKLPPHGKHACSVVHAGAKASGGAISGIATHSQCDQGWVTHHYPVCKLDVNNFAGDVCCSLFFLFEVLKCTSTWYSGLTWRICGL